MKSTHEMHKGSPEGDLNFQLSEPGLWSSVYTLFLIIIIIIIIIMKGPLSYQLRGAEAGARFTH